jgi:hypothetical protein
VRQNSAHLGQGVEGRLDILEAWWAGGFGPGKILNDAVKMGVERNTSGPRRGRQVRFNFRLKLQSDGHDCLYYANAAVSLPKTNEHSAEGGIQAGVVSAYFPFPLVLGGTMVGYGVIFLRSTKICLFRSNVT